MASHYTTQFPADFAPGQVRSKFSASICLKVPALRHYSTPENARWILRNPVKLTTLERSELLALAREGA